MSDFMEKLRASIRATVADPKPYLTPQAAEGVEAAPAASNEAGEPLQTIRQIADEIGNNIFDEANVAEVAEQLQTRIPQPDFDYFNEALKKRQQRQLTWNDLATIYVAFHHNVTRNDDGGCPLNSII